MPVLLVQRPQFSLQDNKRTFICLALFSVLNPSWNLEQRTSKTVTVSPDVRFSPQECDENALWPPEGAQSSSLFSTLFYLPNPILSLFLLPSQSVKFKDCFIYFDTTLEVKL